MSQENVEVVQRIYDALNRDDWEAVFREGHPDFEATFQRGPNAGTHQGRAAVQDGLQDLRAAFEVWIIEPEEFFESGDQVVAIVKNRVRPKGSSAEIEFRGGHLWTIRDGRALVFRGFPAPEGALEAAGLSE